MEEKLEEDSNNQIRLKPTVRSQSVTQKDIKSASKLGLNKRSSSRSKGISNEKNSSMAQALTNLGKDLKDEIEI